MVKHERAGIVKPLIESGLIKEFREIFIYVPKTPVSEHLGITFARFDNFLENVKDMTFGDMYLLCHYFDIESKKMFELIENQHNNTVKKSTRKK
jgi:hypothetical protein